MLNTDTSYPWPEPFPPAWADDWGEDRHGLYAGFSVEDVHQRCRWIPPGTFQMGSPPDEHKRNKNETQHTVTLTAGYWLADTACTQALWQAVLGKNPAKFNQNLEHPVEHVSWDDVQIFVDRLNGLVNGNLDACLPTEAQWEYACRAGTTTVFSFGDDLATDQANYDGNYLHTGGRQRTLPVCIFLTNLWGLYQMQGNVWEWCQDGYADYPEVPMVDPINSSTGGDRVIRGGSWVSLAWDLRSAVRAMCRPGFRSNDLGFRLSAG